MGEVHLASFAVLSVLGMLVPGPDVALAITNGSRHGMRHALAGIAGVVLSDLLLVVAVAVGLGTLLAASEYGLVAARIAGAAYLAFIGFSAFRTAGVAVRLSEPGSGAGGGAAALCFRSFVVAFSNPEAWLFFSAILPPFIDADRALLPQYAVLTLIVAVADASVLLVYAMLGAQATQLFRSARAIWIDRIYGSALLGLAGTLVLSCWH